MGHSETFLDGKTCINNEVCEILGIYSRQFNPDCSRHQGGSAFYWVPSSASDHTVLKTYNVVLHIVFNFEVDRKVYFNNIYDCMLTKNVNDLIWKIMHGAIPTSRFMCGCKYSDSPNCNYWVNWTI